VYSEADRPFLNELAQELRGHGVPTEVFFKAPKLGKQIEYAEAKGIRYVLFVDAEKKIQAKDLATKEQVAVSSLSMWAESIQAR
jgi:histidyl-tRNA synthetase